MIKESFIICYSFFFQKRRSTSFFQSASIKEEPFSPRDTDVNVVDDDDDNDDDGDKITTFVSSTGAKVRNVKKASATTATTATTMTSPNNNNNNIIINKETKLPQLRQTVRLTRVILFLIRKQNKLEQ